MPTWKTEAEEEIRLGLEERARGMEGRARVRARRAAGHILGEYFRRAAVADPGPNAYERLKHLLALPDVPPEARAAARYLTMKVNMDFPCPWTSISSPKPNASHKPFWAKPSTRSLPWSKSWYAEFFRASCSCFCY